MFHQLQKSLAASDTIRRKLALEREAADVNLRIKNIHTDNRVFNSAKFSAHCKHLKQKIGFSAVGAHHQNGVAENAIPTICNTAHANMMHAMIRWPERNMLDLWPFAMSYAIRVHNRFLSTRNLVQAKDRAYSELPRRHVFGCPIYVLDPVLQDGKKISKWDNKARQGIFVGFSDEHSSLAPLVLNPKTQHISPQYHVIFDDKFTTVPSLNSVEEQNAIWNELFKQKKNEIFIDVEDLTLSRTLLKDQWLNEEELRHKQTTGQVPLATNESTSQESADDELDPVPVASAPPILCQNEQPPVSLGDEAPASPSSKPALSDVPQGDSQDPEGGPQEGVSNSSTSSPPPAPEEVAPSLPADCSVHLIEPSPMNPHMLIQDELQVTGRMAPLGTKVSRSLLFFLALPMFALSAVKDWGQPLAAVTNIGASEGMIYSSLKVSKARLSNLAVLQDNWSQLGKCTHMEIIGDYASYLEPDVSDNFKFYTLADVQPHILQAKMSISDPDNPTYRQAMASPDADKWWDAMVLKIKMLEDNMKC